MTQHSSTSAWRQITHAYQLIGVLLLNTLVLVIVLELMANVILVLRPTTTLAQSIAEFKAKMLNLDYYAGQDWSVRYWDEHFQIVDNWSYSPYALWRTRPHEGALLNVDEDGIRATPSSTCDDNSYRIFTFGGSTMWGYGVYDGATIAAYIQAGFGGENVCVVNYGEVGYNSTQGAITLLRLLQSGTVPDMVIFYDGTNDVTLAQRTSEPGTHFYLENIAPVVQGNIVHTDATAPALRDILRQTALYRLIVGEPTAPEPNWAQPPFDATFVDAVVNTYLTNIRTVAALAEDYDFEFFAFLQPVLPVIQREIREGEEQRFLWEMPGGLAELFREVYPRWQTAAAELDYLYDVSNALDDDTLPMWIDFNHLTGWGNLAIANEILAIIRPKND
jgi:lysophospholipase L1-like esterase